MSLEFHAQLGQRAAAHYRHLRKNTGGHQSAANNHGVDRATAKSLEVAAGGPTASGGLRHGLAQEGYLAHLALFLWAIAASGLSWHALREVSRSNRRFEDFVAAIARVDTLIRNRR